MRVAALLRSAALPNAARLVREGSGWAAAGDAVDVTLLAAPRKGGLAREEVHASYPLASRIPYEPDRKYAASFHLRGGGMRIFVKGAPETLIAMADRMDIGGRAMPIDREALARQKDVLAGRGLRVLAFAEGKSNKSPMGGTATIIWSIWSFSAWPACRIQSGLKCRPRSAIGALPGSMSQ